MNKEPDLILLGDTSRYDFLKWLSPSCFNQYSREDWSSRPVLIEYGKDDVVADNNRLIVKCNKILPNTLIIIKPENRFSFEDDYSEIIDGKKADSFKNSVFCFFCEFPFNTKTMEEEFQRYQDDKYHTIITYVEKKRLFAYSDIDAKENTLENNRKAFIKKFHLLEQDAKVVKEDDFSDILLLKKDLLYNSFYALMYECLQVANYIKAEKIEKRLNTKLADYIRELSLYSNKYSVSFADFTYYRYFNKKNINLISQYKNTLKKIIFDESLELYSINYLIGSFIKEKSFITLYPDMIFWDLESDIKTLTQKALECFDNWKPKLQNVNLSDFKTKMVYELWLHGEKKPSNYDRLFKDKFKEEFVNNLLKNLLKDYFSEKSELLKKISNIILEC